MKPTALFLIGWILGGPVSMARATEAQAAAPQLAKEQKHFLECLAYVYRPELWISYRGNVYFAPKSEAEFQKIESMVAARSAYVALTNRETRHKLAAAELARSGVAEAWQQKLLLPVSETNLNLTPTLDRPLRVVRDYRVLQSLGGGDFLIQDQDAVYFVMEGERGLGEGPGANAFLLKEGMKTYRTAEGRTNRVEAFTCVALNNQESSVFRKVAAAFAHAAESVETAVPSAVAAGPGFPGVRQADEAVQEFKSLLSRANDSNPYMQYLVAKAYLEGNGTPRNAELGREWMNRAARNGSGDARKYLEKSEQKTR